MCLHILVTAHQSRVEDLVAENCLRGDKGERSWKQLVENSFLPANNAVDLALAWTLNSSSSADGYRDERRSHFGVNRFWTSRNRDNKTTLNKYFCCQSIACLHPVRHHQQKC